MNMTINVETLTLWGTRKKVVVAVWCRFYTSWLHRPGSHARRTMEQMLMAHSPFPSTYTACLCWQLLSQLSRNHGDYNHGLPSLICAWLSCVHPFHLTRYIGSKPHILIMKEIKTDAKSIYIKWKVYLPGRRDKRKLSHHVSRER